VNDEKLDRIFEEAFKVEYRKEFKQELKEMLLKEYDRREKRRYFLKISTVVAAFIVLAIVAFGTIKLDLMRLNVQDTSFVKTEMENAFHKEDTSTRQETKQNDNKNKSGDFTAQQKVSQDINIPEKSQTRVKEKQSTNNTFFASSSKKTEFQKSSDIIEKPATIKNNNKNAFSSQKPAISSSLPRSSTKKIIENDVKKVPEQNTKKVSKAASETKSSDTSVVVTTQNKEIKKENQYVIVKEDEKVSESVYVLKEEDLKIDKEYILDVLSSVVSSNVYEKENSTLQDTVVANVYEGYFNFKVAKSDTPILISRFSEFESQEDVLKSVYDKTNFILQGLGIKDYKITVFPVDEGYRAEITVFFDGYRIFDVDSFIDYSSSADVISGKIYLKGFSVLKSMKIIDKKTAAQEFEKKYNLKDINPSDIAIVYKKTEKLFIPTYIYIHENKIYWLEK